MIHQDYVIATVSNLRAQTRKPRYGSSHPSWPFFPFTDLHIRPYLLFICSFGTRSNCIHHLATASNFPQHRYADSEPLKQWARLILTAGSHTCCCGQGSNSQVNKVGWERGDHCLLVEKHHSQTKSGVPCITNGPHWVTITEWGCGCERDTPG